MWSKGIINVLGEDGKMVSIEYWCKHWDEGSCFGIDEGCISKLKLRQNGKEVYNFDRGLDVDAQTPEAKKALEILMKKYN